MKRVVVLALLLAAALFALSKSPPVRRYRAISEM
jgi:hypothetical protein